MPITGSVALRIRPIAVTALFVAIIGSVQAASTIVVDQRGLVFNMKSAELQRGDRMIYQNSDDVTHNIHVFKDSDDDLADLGLQKPGVKLSYKFDQAGRFTVRCNIHPSMKMVVTVK
jgi:plastocyanin